MPRTFGLALAATLIILSRSAQAGDINASPSDYKTAVANLKPGDTLHLAAGQYSTLLAINGLQGTEAQPIVIEGPASGDPAEFLADPGPCCNTVEIKNSAYVVLRNIKVNGNGVEGAFGVSAKDGINNKVHHITIEGCTFVGHDASQQTVAISTKTPTWGWVIRKNKIIGAGTGMYLGNSNGNDPFVAAVIENNLIADTVGYNTQIKWQNPRPAVDGMPAGPSSTLIRHNVFLKNDRPSPDGDRPNLLLGGFPDSGPGSEDLYEIYGNVFHGNTRESLLQASGRVSIHDNVFVDVKDKAILLQNHDLPLKLARVYNNTIYSAASGITFGSTAPQGSAVFGNLIFADTPVSGTIADQRDNLVDQVANAAQYVKAPSTQLGAMDFYPLAGKCEGTAVAMTGATTDVDFDKDFNGTSKGGFTFRGAYAGAGINPGWHIDQGLKDATASSTGGSGGAAGAAGAAGSAGSAGSGASGGTSPAQGGSAGTPGTGGSAIGDAGVAGQAGSAEAGSQPADSGDDGGCSMTSRPVGPAAWLALLAAGVVLVRRRDRRAR